MPDFCCVYGCGNRGNRDTGKRFFRIPKVRLYEGDVTMELSKKRQEKWLANIRRADINVTRVHNSNGYLKVCSDHFVCGEPSKLYDKDSVDWAPTLNLGHNNVQRLRESDVQRTQRKNQRVEKRSRSEAAEILLELSKKAKVTEPSTDSCETSDHNGIGSSNHASCQTDITMDDLATMETKLSALSDDLQRTNAELYDVRKKALDSNLTFDAFQSDNDKTKFYTGLPSFAILMSVFELCTPYINSTQRNVLTPFQELILVLMRLRLHLQLQDIAYRFCISRATASRIFNKWLDILLHNLNFLVLWPGRDMLQETMPAEFRKAFGKKVAVIIDCFEIFIERPSGLEPRAETWSNYKHHNTVKFLIGITPQGTISFISKAWGGRVSDKEITERSGFLEKLLPGDVVLADRGFNIADSVGYYCATLKIPAFTKGKPQLPALEVETTRKLAHIRIHVERIIGHVRRKYQILKGTLPIEYISKKPCETDTPLDKIVVVCCALTNLCDSIIPME